MQQHVKHTSNLLQLPENEDLNAVSHRIARAGSAICCELATSPVSRTTHLAVLSIAGSDSGGASGIQADLKTFAAFGLHGLSAITAVTAQNLGKVVSVHNISAREVERQILTLFDGFEIRAVKIGMLGSAANVAAVAKTMARVRARNVVLDPVLVSSSGTPLLSARGVAAMRDQLLPLAALLTPNLPEANELLGKRVRGMQPSAAARALRSLGARAVLVKGGHSRGAVVRDALAEPGGVREFRHPRLAIRARGTGCVLSSAIACGLAQGKPLAAAVEIAEEFLQRALREAYRPGSSRQYVLRP
jgi:hydroxymethylpyrimidine/phosphomethylpyrimidine kinase